MQIICSDKTCIHGCLRIEEIIKMIISQICTLSLINMYTLEYRVCMSIIPQFKNGSKEIKYP